MDDESNVPDAIRKSHITTSRKGSQGSQNESFKSRRLLDLQSMMRRETRKIVEDDIRGSDIPTEYIFGAAFLVIFIAGAFIFK